jgi:hypothetical protein
MDDVEKMKRPSSQQLVVLFVAPVFGLSIATVLAGAWCSHGPGYSSGYRSVGVPSRSWHVARGY